MVMTLLLLENILIFCGLVEQTAMMLPLAPFGLDAKDGAFWNLGLI